MGEAPRPELLAELGELRDKLFDRGGEEAPFRESAWLRPAERDERVLRILRHMRAVVTELDANGRMIYVSPSVSEISGFAPEEVIGLHVWERMHPEDLERLGELSRRHGQQLPDRVQFRVRHKDGRWIWTEVESGIRYRAPDGTMHSVHVTRDVTEIKAAVDGLRESEERYRAVVEHSLDVISETDASGRPTYMSPAGEEVFGSTREELAREAPFTRIHRDDRKRVASQVLEAFRVRKTVSIEPFRVQRSDGSWFWYEFSGISYQRADGGQRFVTVGRDVTEQRNRERERRQLEERMQQAQRLESLGVMAGGIAHDFNNLLTPILGDASLALLDLPEDSPLRANLLRIQRAAQRAAQLTEQMLAYAGAESLEMTLLDLTEHVEEMGRLLETAISGKTRLDYELEHEPPPVLGDASQISQLVMNLMTNAVEAVGEGEGHVVLRTGSVVYESASDLPRALGEPLAPGRYVYLEVEDTGSGMDAATRRRIFDPFFTTKFTGRGLGLAAALGIVRGHRGAIDLESEPGRGTRFRVLLPEAPPGPLPRLERPEESPLDTSWCCDASVLVADDEAGVRELIEDTLSRVGVRVICASDGGEAVELFRKHAAHIRLVLLDRTMPATSGEDAFFAIRALRPDVPIILISGYSQARAAASLEARGLAGFLRKPFQPAALLEAARAHLEPGRTAGRAGAPPDGCDGASS